MDLKTILENSITTINGQIADEQTNNDGYAQDIVNFSASLAGAQQKKADSDDLIASYKAQVDGIRAQAATLNITLSV